MDLSTLPAVGAGFPSPEIVERDLDIHDLLIQHKEFTFYVRVQGNSMVGAGIHDTDVLVVDRALDPVQNSVVVVCLNDGYYVKRIQFREQETLLIAEHHSIPIIKVTAHDRFFVWGVVTYALHNVTPRLTRGPVVHSRSVDAPTSLPSANTPKTTNR